MLSSSNLMNRQQMQVLDGEFHTPASNVILWDTQPSRKSFRPG
jgi:hypothetical protein